MRNILLFIFFGAFCMGVFSSCNDEWTDELYTKKVSFKAQVGGEGVADIYLRYEKDGKVTYDLPVIVSGSQTHVDDIDVHISVDEDTLAILNNEKFKYRTDLYYKQLPDVFFNLPSDICHISAGENVGLFPVVFDFSNLDLVEKWVLPLKIMESKNASYAPNYRNGWRIALLHILPFNDYSGTYSATAMNIYIQGSDKESMVQDTRYARVVDENTVFFYAGMIDERAEDRERYKIMMEFEAPDSISADSSYFHGSLSVHAVDSAIDFTLLNTPTYEIAIESDQTKPYLVHRYCTVSIDYQYNDITSIPALPITFRAEGSMTMERKINTLIPDRDQAIQW